MPFTPKKLALLISSLYVFSPLALVQAVDAAEQAESGGEEVAGDYQLELPSTTVIGRQDKDAEGHDKVYQENVTSVYKGREELQRFEVTNPGDVFKGMNGVYSMDTRSSQAITPNIRGITGEGRTPLTIDGTEQSTNVWLHFVGAGNRSYVDPALFRSIEVEKGPSLSRGIKSGVGGAVNIRTIEASDIIPEGDSWGIETNLKTSGNTSKPRFDAASVYGQDYRSLPGAERANLDGINIDTPPARTRSDSQTLNFDDHSEMLAIAGRNEFVDILLSRSERTSGNYYAGKHNADRYSGHPHFAEDTTDRYIPNLTKVYAAGSEVFNTSSETETTLIKNNWYLPNEQKLGLQFMRTDTTFGETTPGRSMLMYAYREGAEQAQPDLDWANMRNFVYEDPRSELRLDSYKLSYDIKPKDSKWLNLETSLWQTKAKGTRYQTGISPWGLDLTDDERSQLSLWESTRADAIKWLGADWWAENAWMFPEPDHDGTIIPLGRQWTNHDRTGFDFSNQMILASNLQLTLGGSYQQEKLDERVEQTNRDTTSMLPDGVYLHTGTDRLGPRSGERKEYSAMLNLAWQATDWLTVTAGTRYLHYTGKDTGTAKRRRQQSAFYEASRRISGLQLQYGELMSLEDRATLTQLRDEALAALNASDRSNPANYKDWVVRLPDGGTRVNNFITEDPVFRAASQRLLSFLSERGMNVYAQHESILVNESDPSEIAFYNMFSNGGHSSSGVDKWKTDDGNYWVKHVLLPSKDGKFDSSLNPFATGEADATEVIDNPYNPGTSIAKYKPLDANYGEIAYERLDAGKAWEMPEDQSGDAFSPVLSATARITPFGTAFMRYAQTTRFPSINELTSSAILDGTGTVGTLATGASKPERSTNWEVGYAHDLTQFFPSLGFADMRISYYNTEIEDFIDRGLYYDSIQFDKKKSSGVELQSRFDTGRVFGSLGATYRLNQKLCDKDYASSLDPYFNRIPTCMTGGFPGTYSGNSLQPKYSIDLLLGTRLFNERLELGWRSVYHAGAENSQLDDLLASEVGSSVTSVLARDAWFRNGNQDGFYWRSVLLHDLYANFEVNKQVALNLGVTNLTDEYYLDPMAKTLLPGPGRTLTAGLKVNF
ncbi:TonB-dependent receptor plug domain-containing protein [Pseudomonas stutzeri]|uniref:TonB-dependent receptor domain-containing protein n=1 Tax=Stutzerimonas stutzeri TaxID=316 RepID=UPI001EB57D96|nr:TonB-dependent receptor [Stutzerimonas stutzeri]MBK3869564.1 TonB-dependent receptor plug domain-containing protein [Stutzerimonas stutzeri]